MSPPKLEAIDLAVIMPHHHTISGYVTVDGHEDWVNTAIMTEFSSPCYDAAALCSMETESVVMKKIQTLRTP